MRQTDHLELIEQIESKQGELNNLLLRLSEIYGDGRYDEVCATGKKICDIYDSKVADKYPFRHQYHSFIEVLRSLKSQDLVDALLENLKIVIEDNKDNKFFPNLLKLYDHISIDIARMSIESEAHNAVVKLGEAAEHSNKLVGDLDRLSKETDDIQHRVESIHIEIVAILGVFSAIVIGFTGGLDIIGGALSNVGTKDFPLIMFSVSLCGMVLFDTLWLLMEFVVRFVKNRKERIIGYVPVLLFNIAMILIMCVAFLMG